MFSHLLENEHGFGPTAETQVLYFYFQSRSNPTKKLEFCTLSYLLLSVLQVRPQRVSGLWPAPGRPGRASQGLGLWLRTGLGPVELLALVVEVVFLVVVLVILQAVMAVVQLGLQLVRLLLLEFADLQPPQVDEQE